MEKPGKTEHNIYTNYTPQIQKIKKKSRPNMELRTLYGTECSAEDAKESVLLIFRKIKDNELNFS
jgi:hypothetical protein